MKYAGKKFHVEQNLAKLAEAKVQSDKIDITLDDNSLYFHDSNIHYKPYPTLKAFHEDTSDVRIAVGPFGSGKTTAIMVAEIIRSAIAMPKCRDGIRRCRWIVIRNTAKQLRETSIDLWRTWCTDLGRVKRRESVPYSWTHDFRDKDGKVHLEVWFLALDHVNQLGDLKSLQATNFFLGELTELSEPVLQYAIARVGRYPAAITLLEGTKYHRYVTADTNAPLDDHWLVQNWEKGSVEMTGHQFGDYQLYSKELAYEIPLENGKTEQHKIRVAIYHQPPGLLDNPDPQASVPFMANPKAENIEHLQGGYQYYFNQLVNGIEFVKVFAQGKYGIIRAGQLVFPNFSETIHSTESIAIDPNHELLIGVDYGYDCPAFVVAQYVGSQLRLIKEFAGKSIYIEDLYQTFVEPWLALNAKGIAYRAWDDPANTMHGRMSLARLGFKSIPALSNKLDDRLPPIARLLGVIRDKQPALLVSKSGCPSLYQAFVGKYVFEMVRVIGEERPKKQPAKSHPYSDVMDGVGYIAQHIAPKVDAAPKQAYDATKFINTEKW